MSGDAHDFIRKISIFTSRKQILLGGIQEKTHGLNSSIKGIIISSLNGENLIMPFYFTYEVSWAGLMMVCACQVKPHNLGVTLKYNPLAV